MLDAPRGAISRTLARIGAARRGTTAALAALVLGLSAVPALAAQNPTPPGEGDFSTSTPDKSKIPGPAEISAAIEQAEREENERKAWLEGPEAQGQRSRSQKAYAGLDAAAAEELLRSTFAAQFEQLNGDPARILSNSRLIASTEGMTATVRTGGEDRVLESNFPVKVEDDEGDERKVDVTLERAPGGFETANALVDVDIPKAADQPIEVGHEGVGVKLGGADGDRVAQPLGDQNVFTPDVLTDTDLLVSPISTGVEIFNVLRSEDSPEKLHYQVKMPVGAELRTDGDWGAEVVKGGEALAVIPQPVATDAQGTEVPVDLTVEGDSLVLTVAHRGNDYAMPILVDPILENDENWIYGQNHDALEAGGWSYWNNGSWWFHGSTYCIYECFGPGGTGTRGLFVSLEGQRSYGGSQFGQWAYSAPPWSYITMARLGPPYVHADHNCPESEYPQPHNYFGLWSVQTNSWSYLSVNSANQPGGSYTLPFRGDSAVFGLDTGGGISWLPCWRDLYAGGAAIWLDDDYAPSAARVQDPPTTWIKPETPVHIVSQASDTGLGIQRAVISSDGSAPIADNTANRCSGTWRSRCLTGYTATWDVHGASFREGRRVASVVAFDATGKASNPYWFETKVDGLAPEVKLEGQLANVTHEDEGAAKGAEDAETLRMPVYNLRINASDGTPGSPETSWQSGVRTIEVKLDGVTQTVPWSPTPSCEHDCGRSVVYPLELSTVQTAGKHTLQVVVTDFAGNPRPRNIEFEYFPATGMKDEYVMQYFPLADGIHEEGEPGHSTGPELAVNVMNGNLVYHETDVEVQSAAELPLEVERFYNSMLPNSENSEWGDGWTLAQTPALQPGQGAGPAAGKAQIVDRSGDVEGRINLPTQVGASTFNPTIQATVTKTADGGYMLKDETGDAAGAVAFDSTGQAEAMVGEGHATIDYGHNNGALSELSVDDPATFTAAPSELEIPGSELITKPTYATSFGSNGSGNGQLISPAGMAIDAQGNLWVVDKGNNRVEKFDHAGKFLLTFGSLGTGNGQFNRPTAVATAANGDVLVVDAGNGRVERFNSSGAFLSKFGAKGTGNGQFNGSGPEGIALDAAGNIWVSDTYGGRLEKFNSSGTFVQAVGTKGSGTGQLGEPTGIDVAPNGDVWVADWQNNRISVFNSAGTFVAAYGSAGTGDGEFSHPDEVEIDALGNVWVGDQSNNRVVLLDLSGQFKGTFGAAGTGPGQFNFAYPMGMVADSNGNIWVADVNNNRIQQWSVPIERPAYASSFGAMGSGDGQFSSPADITEGVEGNLWVIDRSNNRLEKFDQNGRFLAKFGSSGTGDGQFNRPAAVAVDRDGDLLVADAGNNRVDKFDPEGHFISKFGAAGAGNGQFSTPEGIATDFEGDIWVADSGNGRVERFDEEGTFVDTIGTKGSETGQLGRPMGIDIGPEGDVWVADIQNNRISVFDPDGDLVREFGSSGNGPGQFNHPSVVEVGPHGNVWVADSVNQRVQRFDLSGNYVGQFGSSGSGEGQFAMPTATNPVGIATDDTGAIWVTDQNHYRVQRWQLGNYQATAPKAIDLSDADPQVEVDTSGGLVSQVTGDPAGTNTYGHAGDDLTSHVGPDGETKYAYDPAGHMTKVTLPNGTYGSVAYTADGRVKSVTVDPAGAVPAKTTEFVYQDGPPRRTTVLFSDAPHITYDIAEDGSVFKWWNAVEPPTIEMTGNLTDLSYRETAAAIPPGPYYLTAHAWDAEGIASIDVIVNGNQLVDEWKCPEQHALGCVEPMPVNEWVMETSDFAPGVLPIEVVATDQTGEKSAQRFWVNIPQPPPATIGAPTPPRFKDIKRFREEYGLEVNFPVQNEIQLDERIFNLIGAWNNPNSPEGQVARASWERWGVPLRPVDIAELEYREALLAQDGSRIDQWVEETHPGSFAGYYMDQAAGGVLRIGFVGNQAEQLASVQGALSLAGGERLQVYPTPPTVPYVDARDTESDITGLSENNSALASILVAVELDQAGGNVHVGATNPGQAEAIIHESLGAGAPITVTHAERDGRFLSGRFRNSGRMRAGDAIFSKHLNAEGQHDGNEMCTAGFGAKEKSGEERGQAIWRLFVLTAGHCQTTFHGSVYRSTDSDPLDEDNWREVGSVTRTAFHEPGRVETDAEAIRVEGDGIVPQGIFGAGGELSATQPASTARLNSRVCFSGARTQGISCGPIVAYAEDWTGAGDGLPRSGYWVRFEHPPIEGDSGSPVYSIFGASVGLVSASRHGYEETYVVPLLTPRGMDPAKVPGILNDPYLRPLSLKLGE